jgi:hypothetical protein
MADPAFYRAIARLAEVANTDDASRLTPQEVITVLVTALRDAASDLDRVQEDRQHGTLLTPSEIGAYIGVEVPAGAVIADWLRQRVEIGEAVITGKAERPVLHYTTVTLRSGRIDDLMADSRKLLLYKRGDMRLVWVNEIDLRKLEADDLAERVAE